MGITVYSLLWVMQDFVHQPYHRQHRHNCGASSSATVDNQKLIGTLRGVGGRGVGDYTSLNRPYWVLIMGIKAPYPPSPYPPKGPYEKLNNYSFILSTPVSFYPEPKTQQLQLHSWHSNGRSSSRAIARKDATMTILLWTSEGYPLNVSQIRIPKQCDNTYRQ